MLRDVAISGDRNLIKKEAENFLKYTDITIETQNMWNLKTAVTPVITGETGTISDSFRKFPSNIVRQDEFKELHKKINKKQSYWHCKRTSVITNPKAQKI